MTSQWNDIFEKFGVKIVSKTDKNKGAYLPNEEQRIAIAAAGISPSPPDKRPADEFQIAILFDSRRAAIKASYYHAIRVTDPGRLPEARMGHEFISSPWLKVGDKIIIGNIGSELFAAKVETRLYSEDEIAEDVFKKANNKTILERAKQANGKPAKKMVSRNDFVRNPFVVRAAIIRSKGMCETPGCTRTLFPREDNSPYMEVHHIIPLSEDGDDTLINVAALCPHCHRELHFGKLKMAKRAALIKHIEKLT